MHSPGALARRGGERPPGSWRPPAERTDCVVFECRSDTRPLVGRGDDSACVRARGGWGSGGGFGNGPSGQRRIKRQDLLRKKLVLIGGVSSRAAETRKQDNRKHTARLMGPVCLRPRAAATCRKGHVSVWFCLHFSIHGCSALTREAAGRFNPGARFVGYEVLCAGKRRGRGSTEGCGAVEPLQEKI